jgi:DNA replication and repair protein RecF
MRINKLHITSFRNHENVSINFGHNINILYGKNAQGKTSILEAIHLLSFTKSHRTNKDIDMIKRGADFAKINALASFYKKNTEIDIVISKIGKKVKFNRKELEKLSEYIGKINVVMFAPEDITLIKGNPKDRRKFIDVELGQISKDYLYFLQQYKKILRQRNDLLKSLQKTPKREFVLLDVITDQLIDYIEPLIKERIHFLKEVETYAQQHYLRLSSTNDLIEIKYIPSIISNVKDEFMSKYNYDIITGTTNLGVHRDDVNILLNKQLIKTHGSQGEQRTAVLSIKLALIDIVKKHKGENPILLLDDVFSELDQSRQHKLLRFINEDIQTIITTTDINNINIDSMKNVRLFHVKKGSIEESDTNERTKQAL